MRRMNDKYSDDLEVKAFYALALLGSSQGRDVGTYMKAAALVEDVVRANPQHPGAIHYLIHAYDDPAHAPLGLRYAEAYAKIAPAASHALHMPSHIYFALGMWDKAAELNERSAKAADERVSRKGLGVDDRGFHALLWLTYSYLQQGRYQDARGVVDQIDKAAAESGSVRTRSHLALARAAWIIETRRWTDAKPDGVNPEGLGADATAADLFAIGMAAFRSGNRAMGSDALQRMATLAGDGDRPVRSVTTAKPPTAKPNASRPGVAPMPVPRPSLPTPAELIAAQTAAAGQPQTGLPAAGSGNDKRVAAIMAQQLEAILIFSEGRRDEGLVLARQAAAVEDDLSFEFGPPLPVKPGHELVGDLSMDVRRPGDAVVAYEAALKRYPGRALSLLGLYRAAMASRQPLKAQQAAAELRKIWQRADKTLPELREIAAVPPPSSH
jgi:tetratricopeptide (TPR) repeat protein